MRSPLGRAGRWRLAILDFPRALGLASVGLILAFALDQHPLFAQPAGNELQWRRTAKPTAPSTSTYEPRASSVSAAANPLSAAAPLPPGRVQPTRNESDAPRAGSNTARSATVDHSVPYDEQILAAQYLEQAAEPRRLDELTHPVASTSYPNNSRARMARSVQSGARMRNSGGNSFGNVAQSESVPAPQTSAPAPQTPPSPFDDNFPEAGKPVPAAPRSNQPPSVLRGNEKSRGGAPEELPSLPHSAEMVPTPSYEEYQDERMLPIDPEQDWQDAVNGGCGECGECGGQCGPGGDCCNGPRHRPLRRLRYTIRSVLQCVVGGCDPCDEGPFGCGPTPTCGECCGWYWDQDLTIFGGVEGFKGNLDQGRNGNFGFSEGFNWGSPFWNAAGIGFQFGGMATQTNLNESVNFDRDRQQHFLTAGFFRREMGRQGWQYGAVYDQLFDEFTESLDLGQIRGEMSYLWGQHEIGFWFATGSKSETIPRGTNLVEFSTVDQYAAFYRRRLYGNGEGRLWAGFTDNSDTIVGGEFRLPMGEQLALQTGFNYLSPQNDEQGQSEGWNVSMSVVWYLGNSATCAGRSRFRPLFNVADNGVMMTRLEE